MSEPVDRLPSASSSSTPSQLLEPRKRPSPGQMNLGDMHVIDDPRKDRTFRLHSRLASANSEDEDDNATAARRSRRMDQASGRTRQSRHNPQRPNSQTLKAPSASSTSSAPSINTPEKQAESSLASTNTAAIKQSWSHMTASEMEAIAKKRRQEEVEGFRMLGPRHNELVLEFCLLNEDERSRKYGNNFQEFWDKKN